MFSIFFNLVFSIFLRSLKEKKVTSTHQRPHVAGRASDTHSVSLYRGRCWASTDGPFKNGYPAPSLYSGRYLWPAWAQKEGPETWPTAVWKQLWMPQNLTYLFLSVLFKIGFLINQVTYSLLPPPKFKTCCWGGVGGGTHSALLWHVQAREGPNSGSKEIMSVKGWPRRQ